MAEKGPIEKREFSRVEVASMVIIRCDIYIENKKEKLEFHTHTEDVSEGGLKVILEKQLENSLPVELKLHLTGKLSPIECKGQVVWSEAVSPKGIQPSLFATGIKFTELNYDDRQTIRKMISCLSDKD